MCRPEACAPDIDTADRAMYRAKAAGEGIALGDPPGTQGLAAEEATT